jgi:hypothetical protein
MDLYQASHTQHTSQHFSNGFLPPPAQLQLSFTPGAFAAACARACSLTAAGPSVIQAIARSTQELLYIFIDDDPPDPLRILPDANSLADAKLVGLAHDVGAAVADLYLERLGFHWRANGKSVIKSGSVPDMFYDNGHTGTSSVVDVVAVEAKGSMSKGGTIGKIHSKTYKQGYRRQVEPHLGKTYSALTGRIQVVHGYAVGTAAPAGGPVSRFCVHEPVIPAANTDDPGDDLGSSITAPATAVALPHYRALLALIGATRLVQDISEARPGTVEVPVSDEDTWVPVVVGGEEFLTTRQTPYLPVGADAILVPAISAAAVSALRSALPLLRRGELGSRLPLPRLSDDFLIGMARSDPLQFAFADGFAVVPLVRFETAPRSGPVFQGGPLGHFGVSLKAAGLRSFNAAEATTKLAQYTDKPSAR